LLALLGAHHFLYVSRIRVKLLTFRLLMSHIYIYIYIYDICRLKVNIPTTHIQGDLEGICNTLGNDSVCDSNQKSSYEYGSDFEPLPRYGKKKIRTILRARTAIT